MPQEVYRGYTIITQHTVWDGCIRYRYQITRLSPSLTHVNGEWEHFDSHSAATAAKARIDTFQGAD